MSPPSTAAARPCRPGGLPGESGSPLEEPRRAQGDPFVPTDGDSTSSEDDHRPVQPVEGNGPRSEGAIRSHRITAEPDVEGHAQVGGRSTLADVVQPAAGDSAGTIERSTQEETTIRSDGTGQGGQAGSGGSSGQTGPFGPGCAIRAPDRVDKARVPDRLAQAVTTGRAAEVAPTGLGADVDPEAGRNCRKERAGYEGRDGDEEDEDRRR